MAADILHNIAVLRGQIAAQAAEDPSLLRIAAQRGVDLRALGEAGSAAAAEWQPRGSSRGSSSESGDDDSVARRARALRDDFANRRRRDILGGYPHPRTLPPPPPQHSPLSRSRVSTRPGPTRQSVISSLEAMNQASGQAAREHHERAARAASAARSRVRFPHLEYELVEQDELDEGEVSDDASSSMLSQILSIR